jgi:hypothetical protein
MNLKLNVYSNGGHLEPQIVYHSKTKSSRTKVQKGHESDKHDTGRHSYYVHVDMWTYSCRHICHQYFYNEISERTYGKKKD